MKGAVVFFSQSSAFACQTASFKPVKGKLGERLLKLSDL
jgi:hypothetical protein